MTGIARARDGWFSLPVLLALYDARHDDGRDRRDRYQCEMA
jgi:hypothetical protein